MDKKKAARVGMPMDQQEYISHLQTAQNLDDDVTISHHYSSGSTLASPAHRLISLRTFASCIYYISWATLTRRLDILRSTLCHRTSTGSTLLSHLGNLFADAFDSSSIKLWALGGLATA